jgi:hypothetical protein
MPLLPKFLHWFGGIGHVSLARTRQPQPERRGCWLTATCLFLSEPSGPQPDGRDIRRCIGYENIHHLLLGPGNHLAITTNSGPQQPGDLLLLCDSAFQRGQICFIIERCYAFRVRQPLFVKAVDGINMLRLEDEHTFRPQLYRMATHEELDGLVRGRTE